MYSFKEFFYTYATLVKTDAIGMYVILMKLFTRKSNCISRKKVFF